MLNLLGRTAVSHEDVFLARYDALRRVALRVTDGDSYEAEDLVHEAFMRFTLVQPPLDEVQHLDAYLARMLRNMHTSRIRRRQRAAETSLSILDYDSLDVGFHAVDGSAQLEARDALRAACEYGCVRKRSSKSGSVFLLRFFHGYLPSEIASLSRLSSAIVDALVFRARREVKGYVDDTGRLAFIGPRITSAVGSRESAVPERRTGVGSRQSAAWEAEQSEQAFVHELRGRIFNDTHERCWSKAALRDRYRDSSAEALSRDDFADLVGCPTCLDAASALLGLPSLAERWPVDTIGPGTRGGPKSGPPSGPPAAISSGRRRAQTIFEHRPRQLRVSVNGFILGSHTIGAERNELTLSVNLGEPIALVELFSEQELCLLFLDTSPPPDGNARQRRRIDLSSGRHAELEVTFDGPWPTVRASYDDPRPRLSAHAEDELAGEVEARHEVQQVITPARQPRRLFGLTPVRATVLFAVVLAWLLFWTPGTTVSAAERIIDTIKWLVSSVLGTEAAAPQPLTAPPRALAHDISLPAAPAAVPLALTSARRVYLELKALTALQQADAYLGQELSLAPLQGAQAGVQATVDTAARRTALRTALGPLLSEPGLRTTITSLSDAGRRSPRPALPTSVRAFAFTNDRFPLFDAVRLYVVHQEQFAREAAGATSGSPIDEATLDTRTRAIAVRVLDRARRASQHAWALKHLADHFTFASVDAASDDARGLWRALVRQHAQAYQHEIVLLRRDLEPVVRPFGVADTTASAPDADVSPSITAGGADDTWQRIGRLLETHRRHERAVQAAFTVQAGEDDDVEAVDGAGFWHLIDASEALAVAIARDPFDTR